MTVSTNKKLKPVPRLLAEIDRLITTTTDWTDAKLNRLHQLMRKVAKLMLHEHLDCSLRPRRMLELWEKLGFDTAAMGFPAEVLSLWRGDNIPANLTGNARGAALRASRNQAAAAYQRWLIGFASASLDNYLRAIVDHILPLMQSRENIAIITRDRIDDAVNDGLIALELRFAPQLHTQQGLTLDEVMETVIDVIKDSPIPIDLTLCSLRHENADMARQIGDLCVKYQKWVGSFDLAGGEGVFPGVLDWWLTEAVRARSLRRRRKLTLKIHIGETNELTLDDHRKLDDNGITIEGHGVRDLTSGRTREVCITSNVVTAQFASVAEHNVDELYRDGKPVTLSTDGLTLTGLWGLTDEYVNVARFFGWTTDDLYRVNLNALEALSFTTRVKAEIRRELKRSFGR